MSQENKYPNYPKRNEIDRTILRNRLEELLADAEAWGYIITVETLPYELAMGHYVMVPEIRPARMLCHDKAANRAVAAANLDPLLLVPPTGTPTKELSGNSFHIDEAAQADTHYWFEQNGFSLVVFEQVIDAVYSLRMQPRAFDAFKRTQHAITLSS